MEDSERLKYYSNVTKFSNVRTFLAFLRTCAVFVGLAIYLKNRYIFLLVVAILLFGIVEFFIINKKLEKDKISLDLSSYNNLVLTYSGLFAIIFLTLFIKPPF